MAWPQITMIVLFSLGLGVAMAKHGQPRTNYNFWWTLIDAALMFYILKSGGFF